MNDVQDGLREALTVLLLLDLVAVLGVLVAVMERRTGLAERALWWHPPRSAVGLWVVVAVSSALQLVVPGWYDALFRSPDQIMHHRQVWRLLTAVFVQDGGAAGTTFNLILLALSAVPVARYFGGPVTWLLFLGCGIGLNLLGAVYDASGAGNSGATLAMACALLGNTAAVGPVRRGAATRSTVLLAVVPLLLGAVTWALIDYHGEAQVIGWAVGAVLGFIAPDQFPKGPGSEVVLSGAGRRRPSGSPLRPGCPRPPGRPGGTTRRGS